MKKYIGVKIVQAEPAIKDGKDGYKVVYKDGYESWCPKDAFEEANREMSAMPFSHAFEALKAGKKVARASWNGKGLWIRLLTGAGITALTQPILVVEYPVGHTAYPNGSCIPWFPSQSDMLSNDWYVVE